METIPTDARRFATVSNPSIHVPLGLSRMESPWLPIKKKKKTKKKREMESLGNSGQFFSKWNNQGGKPLATYHAENWSDWATVETTYRLGYLLYREMKSTGKWNHWATAEHDKYLLQQEG